MKRSYIIAIAVAIALLIAAWIAGSAYVNKKTSLQKQGPASITAPKQQKNSTIPPLPADEQQAIDTEIQGIDQELDKVDASLSSDPTDSELGL